MRQTNVSRSPVITVYRKISAIGDRYWYFSGGRPFEMAATIALKEAEAGPVILRTVGDAQCA